MIYLILAFLLIGVFYIAGIIAFIRYSKIAAADFYTEPKEHFDDLITTDQEFEDAENQLKKDPDNLEVRLKILRSMFVNSEGAKKDLSSHSRWIIENRPEYAVLKIVEVTFLVSPEDQRKNWPNFWQPRIDAATEPNNLLRIAAEFCSLLNSDFSITCLKKLIELEPLNPRAQLDLAFRLYLNSKWDEVSWNETSEAYQSARRQIWSEDEFWRCEYLRRKVSKLLFPNVFAKAALFSHGLISKRGFDEFLGYYHLSYAGFAALNNHEYREAERIEKFLTKKIKFEEVGRDCPEAVLEAYDFLCVMAAKRSDLNSVRFYLGLKSKIANKSHSQVSRSSYIANYFIDYGLIEIFLNHIKTQFAEYSDSREFKCTVWLLERNKKLNRIGWEEYNKLFHSEQPKA